MIKERQYTCISRLFCILLQTSDNIPVFLDYFVYFVDWKEAYSVFDSHVLRTHFGIVA